MEKMISIIIPVYGVEQYIAECLQSVINQTYTKNVECILIDDCGQDKSIEIAEKIIAEYKGAIHFSIHHHEHNKGLSGARNTGIHAAKGEYLYFLDSDDMIEPFCLEKLTDTLKQHPDSQMVFAGLRMTENTISHVDFAKADLPDYSNNPDWIQSAMLSCSLNISSWNKLVRKDFIIKNNLFFAEGYIHEDDIWNFDVSKHLSIIAICHYNTYIYRVRENSIMTTTSLEQNFINRSKLVEYKAKAISEKNKKWQLKNVWMTLLDLYNKKTEIKDLLAIRDRAANELLANSQGFYKVLIWGSIRFSWMAGKYKIYNYLFYKFAKINNTTLAIIKLK